MTNLNTWTFTRYGKHGTIVVNRFSPLLLHNHRRHHAAHATMLQVVADAHTSDTFDLLVGVHA